MNTITRAAEAVGGGTALASRLGVTRQAVHKWMTDGFAPPKRAIEIAKLTNFHPLDMVDEETRTLAIELVGL